jgi:hypothetical protein
MQATIALSVVEGALSGQWVTSTGDTYQLSGTVGQKGDLSEASAQLEPATLELTGRLGKTEGKGLAKGWVGGGLSCQGPWQVAKTAQPEEGAATLALKDADRAEAEPPAADEDAQKPKKAAPAKTAKAEAPKAEPKSDADPLANNRMGLDFETGAYYALVIGNINYSEMPKLKTAVADAQAVSKILTEKYGFKTTLLTNATRRDIIAALSDLRRNLRFEDNLLIYYAGHGIVDPDTEQGYWLPVDAERDNPANWVSNADLTNLIRALPSQHVLLIADSCYSGTLTRGVDVDFGTNKNREAWLRRMAEKRSRTILASGGVEPVADDGGGRHSVFAKALIDTLQSNTDVADAQSLFSPVLRKVVLNANQTPRYDDIRMAGHDDGDFIFVPRK